MNKDQVLGMIVGTAIGDAYGAPFEFMHPEDIVIPDGYSYGGAHDVSIGEWTDDTALMLATADAYITSGGLNLAKTVQNFKRWRESGTFGTRDYVFDIGATTSRAIDKMTVRYPFAGKAEANDSGNGSIMRIAPAIAANHNNMPRAVGEAVALSLMTHGNEDTIKYVSAFVAKVMGHDVDAYCFDNWDINRHDASGTVMHAFHVAIKAQQRCSDFTSAMEFALKLGYDTDTNCAVTGTLMGATVGLSGIPKKLKDGLMDFVHIVDVADRLWKLGTVNLNIKE